MELVYQFNNRQTEVIKLSLCATEGGERKGLANTLYTNATKEWKRIRKQEYGMRGEFDANGLYSETPMSPGDDEEDEEEGVPPPGGGPNQYAPL